ncbi:sulfotransferase domain-containing protein [Psychroflexus montanilacus]|uniref:sulfotransferase domain-containing protein n=1 Tax=Psychroflexus montanilacus TaxID=2873598 RepID=UPI001CCB41A9|nr:sulfotransferase domain-containing protein [Psychroflexus montanilacus]MBZ9652098.1 sulfotransferase domain-containing protein [Psychroflexus montanilacus]
MSQFNKHVIVVGTARSGTSWLSENMAKVFRYRMLFEPEHTERTKSGHLIADQLIINSNYLEYKEGLKYLEHVLKNRVNSDWIAQNSNRKYKMHLWPFLPKQFIIKFVRGNLMAPFLNQYYDIPVVHVIRNPYEVIKSQQRVKFPWLYDLSYFAKQNDLKNILADKYQVHVEDYKSKSVVEILALRWCIENVVVIEDLNANQSQNYHIVKHEDLRTDVGVYKNLCATLGIEVLDGIEKEYKKPSTKAHPKSTVRGQNDDREFLNEGEKGLILKVLEKFGQKFYEL